MPVCTTSFFLQTDGAASTPLLRSVEATPRHELLLVRAQSLALQTSQDLDAAEQAEVLDVLTAQQSDDTDLLSLAICGFEERPLIVTDDFPSTASICQAELDAIERFMGEILDEVFGHSATVGEGQRFR